MSQTQAAHQTNQGFYDRISHAYDSIADANEHVARQAGETLLAIQPGERVLEIGYGTGNSLIAFAHQVGPKGHVCGLDVSPGMREVTLKKVQQAGLADRIDAKVGDAVALDWPNDWFDAAFMSFTLELFRDEDIHRVLQQLQRVLKPSGRLASVSMATVAEGEKESLLEKTYQWSHRHFPHIVDCRPIDAVAAMKSAGFEIERENRMSIWTMPVSVVLATNH
ncbi:methyltransferase domain-containing protein [Stieleria sp. TO1_6]|uniref:class I SAM-dependent methyltransferase n=1 Tax=Stieleria tagensis TaxID=2956795 RepID=UPI00209AFF3B|nr:methyltransferase domain-containing protein [Stieleria tagensis]MCO8123835.1 methyltransferase domain-containing protein [Stieleria tagensis]